MKVAMMMTITAMIIVIYTMTMMMMMMLLFISIFWCHDRTKVKVGWGSAWYWADADDWADAIGLVSTSANREVRLGTNAVF